MALRIFETDPDAKPRPRNPFMDDIVGRFRAGELLGRRPVSLSEWRVTTDDEDVAGRIADLLGGEPAEWNTEKADNIEVKTEANSVEIIIESAAALQTRMALYGMQGPIHLCDGMYSLAEEDKGEPCGCPRTLQERKEKAKAGKGPKPDIRLRFRLAADEELGYFLFSTGSWSLVNDLPEIEDQLANADGPVRATLAIELVEYTTKQGRDVSYYRSVITINGPVK